MAFTQIQIDALKSAIATGTLRVRYADRDVQYRSLEEMRQTLAMMRREVGAVTRTRQIRVDTSKGFES